MEKMKILLFSLFTIFTISPVCLLGQKEVPPNDILKLIEGSFDWEMIRSSDSTLLRKGKRTSQSHFQGAFLFHESFENSPLQQIGALGFDHQSKRFFLMGFHNEQQGPYLIWGEVVSEVRPITIQFEETKERRVELRIYNRTEHHWQGYQLVNAEWKALDLIIKFKAK